MLTHTRQDLQKVFDRPKLAVYDCFWQIIFWEWNDYYWRKKAIVYPTDARLYHKARSALVRLAKRMGIAATSVYPDARS